MKTLYAWQVAPEDQESPRYWDGIGERYSEVAVTGNRDYKGHLPAKLKELETLDDIAEVSRIMGEPYKQVTIRGCCQGDWQELYCPASWTREQVQAFEAEYFNTGTEWLVAEEASEDDDESTSPQDVDTCSYYDPMNDEEAFRAMLAQEYGLDVSQVVLYAHDGYQKKARYKRV